MLDIAGDSALPGAVVHWVVDSDAYSHNPADDLPGTGLGSDSTVTDSTGSTLNTFSLSGAPLFGQAGDPGGPGCAGAGCSYGSYFYVEAQIADTTGVVRQSAKFYLIAYQVPVMIGIWDSTAIDSGVGYDLAQHVQLYIAEGADTKIDTLTISSFLVGGTANCSSMGTVVTCANSGEADFNITPLVPPADTIVNPGATFLFSATVVDSVSASTSSKRRLALRRH